MVLSFSKEEEEVLKFYFTNLDKPVFATKNFHPEIWALMQARYSRSREGLREGFLDLLKEDPENFNALKEEIEKIAGGAQSQHAIEKAIQFMERWVLGYGHSSVAEGAVVGLGLEGVSILATKVIEDNRLCSFIEKSTRYVSFDEKSFYIDPDLSASEFFPEIKELIDLLFKTYMDLHEPVLEYVKSVAPKDDKTPLAAWERACAARRFDAIRYLLPTCTKTSLGWTVNARQLAHGVSKLLSHPLKEMNQVGLMVKDEATQVLPSLLKFADKKNYFIKTEQEMNAVADSIRIEDGAANNVTLVRSAEEVEEMVIASILYRYKQQPLSRIYAHVKSMRKEEREKVFDAYLKHMSEFDNPLRELEHVKFTFDIVMDYGAFRDLQRHRICTQTNQLFTASLGYDVPKDIINAGCEKQFRHAMDTAKKVYERVSKKYPLQAQYLLPLGFRKRFLITMNLREVYHLVKIRTTPLAHDSYRRIAYKIYEMMKQNYPLLSKYIVCNYSQEELGRLKSEEKTERKKSVGFKDD